MEGVGPAPTASAKASHLLFSFSLSYTMGAARLGGSFSGIGRMSTPAGG